MEAASKIKILNRSASYDVCSSCSPRSEQNGIYSRLPNLGGIYQASTPRGCSNIFKVLMTNKCIHNCFYCINARSSNIERTELTPEELASTFRDLHQRHLVQGMFLSSAINDAPENTMLNMIKAVEIVRYRYNFQGFIHLKILPGASDATIAYACKIANRASINIEAPSASRLSLIARSKQYEKDIIRTMRQITLAQRAGYLSSGQTTQFIVGAAGESDQEILQTSAL
ncbi:MAG: radical SAM protein, partial [Patescibacteria group bacterium]